ncbi:hypothetical protein ABL78_6671 [Leptomonas seymouri]|uniref:EF-hand domain-containing protein n=1 Tax=Leptomonas seymouri TaxID=5684 RepID=A0A0N1PCT6_LEPSE|nr:hypothetical protein ABL78_6671 [Leptomonas seymouri]|eukprot:KPI84280.1 hypothetical protein ABL78_6671 [Leptomonas seymouri]
MSSSIHVILLGTDAFRVEGALQGAVMHTHKAWNKYYQLSCTSALSVDKVDKRLLLVCHVIVLSKGCRSPASTSSYGNRPVLALPDATPSCLEELQGSNFYYGVCTLDELKKKALAIGLAPPHVIYDAILSRFTPIGEAAFKRAFWLLDRDADGLLRLPELVGWRRQVESEASNAEDMATFLSEWGGEVAAAKQADSKAFLELHLGWLTGGKVMEAWATLHASGIHPDGLPYSWYDLHAIRVDRETNTYLSTHAIQFFTNVYKLKHFSDTADIWAVTPGCPWEDIDSFLQERVPMVKYVEYWKYMALVRREDVIRYARYLGYKGEISHLFSRRYARAYRAPQETIPNTINVLVVGAAHSGRRSLIYALTSSGHDLHQRQDLCGGTCVLTTTFFATKGRDEAEEAQTLVYTTVAPEESQRILSDPERSKIYDVALLCYDGSDIPNSGAYLMRLFDAVCATEGCERMPFVVVMTKADAVLPEVSGEAVEAGTQLQDYCLAHQLLWPPVITSSEEPDQSEATSLNQYMYAVTCDPTLAVGPPPLTCVRIVRRATFVAILAVVAAGAAQTLISYLRRRRR